MGKMAFWWRDNPYAIGFWNKHRVRAPERAVWCSGLVRAFVQAESWLHLCGEGMVAVAVGLHRGIHAIGKYIEDNKSQVSHCQRRELQILYGKGES